MRRISIILAVVLLTALNVVTVLAQDRGNPNWFLRATGYVFWSNIDGAVNLGQPANDQIVGLGLVVPVEDTLLETNFAARLEAGKGRWRGLFYFSRGTTVNSASFHLESDPDTSILGAYDLTWYIGEAYAVVTVGPFTPDFAIDLLAGARYNRQKETLIDSTTSETLDIDEKWVEPVVGARAFFNMGNRFWAQFNGDMGGFAIGSDFSWTLGGELGFRVFRNADINLRYNYYEVQYNNGKTGAERFEWQNGVKQGWFLGATLKL